MINLSKFFLKNDPSAYLPDAGLLEAIEIAIALGKPLLITGEPGTGKTKMADWLAYNLAKQTKGDQTGLAFREKPFFYSTKSTSVSSDLFYYYDAVSHFGKMQIKDEETSSTTYIEKSLFGKEKTESEKNKNNKEDTITRKYIELRSLGLAIAQTHGLGFKTLQGIKNYKEYEEADRGVHAKPKSCVVLIDEIDKAPREFPNDLLNEIENYKFEIKELNIEVSRAENDCRVIIILTSNDEKTLPNAFLRRCVFYHINFPEPDKLMKIAKLKLGLTDDNISFDNALLTAINKFKNIRERVPNKKPSTSELFEWLNILFYQNNLKDEDGSLHPKALDPKYKAILIKTSADQESI